LFKLLGYFQGDFAVNWQAVVLGSVVVVTMLLWPARLNARFPASLLGIVLATALNAVLRWPVPVIGAIPQTLLLADRLSLSAIPWDNLSVFVAPALTITALGAVESLLCGAVASNMTGIRLQANQELIGQGVGNIVIPFFGGVPATAAIARTSVGIKAGGKTPIVSFSPPACCCRCSFLLRDEPYPVDGIGRCVDGHRGA
jgi:SulP family sulfate permease